MTTNLGRLDRLIRAFGGLALVFAPLSNIPPIWSNAAPAYVAMAVGVILVATALFSFCPIYRLIGVSTCKV
ncbi:MAG: DUF2892 domain-containing protein [Pseudomonadota bacterium]